MKQYLTVKEKYKNAILMYRLGDFYEMFFEDAKIASRELELTLTGRDCGEAERAPMCGVPFHAVDNYIGRLISKGYTVVICEQTEDPALAKGLVKREVTRIVTPGTVTDTSQIDETKNNFIAGLYITSTQVSLCFADLTTGETMATNVNADDDMSLVINELSVYSPSEIIANTDIEKYPKLFTYITDRIHAAISYPDESIFDRQRAIERLRADMPEGYNDSDEFNPAYISLGAVISYIDTNLITVNFSIKSFELYGDGQYLKIDASTRRNLELCETMRERAKKGSLLHILDRTKTSPGARLLRRCIEMPLVNQRAIIYRQDAVAELYGDLVLRSEAGRILSDVFDLERLMPKIIYGSATARDLRALCDTLSLVPKIRELLTDATSAALVDIREKTDPLEDITSLINRAIIDRPPFSIREGGFIADGYSEELDRLRKIKNGAKDFLDKIENDERERTGIKTLKIGYNRVFGYYIEVSKSFKDLTPDNYIRKQTLTNGERYITPELKELEETILSADDKINSLEYSMFRDICDAVTKEASRISATAGALAFLDMYLSLATVAAENSYVRPEVTYDDVIDIKEGRHPVVEKFVKDFWFTPNDAHLDTGYNRLMILTGPNMGGKSTYMRQIALICIMAQIGSFVPASEARIGIIDKLFTRVGASDDLASGQSTFMLEMSEVAYILKNATKRSLIIYDEIGRGTSTFDGMSIAKAVAEYTAGKNIGAKTLFATHYHEITNMESEIDGVFNMHIAAKKYDNGIVFLRKVVYGPADDSFGIDVARIAGLPQSVIKRANEVLKELEKSNPSAVNGNKKDVKAKQEEDFGFFGVSLERAKNDDIAEKLRSTNIDTLTPIEALNLIYQLKNML